jgi:hypothetical protein
MSLKMWTHSRNSFATFLKHLRYLLVKFFSKLFHFFLVFLFIIFYFLPQFFVVFGKLLYLRFKFFYLSSLLSG